MKRITLIRCGGVERLRYLTASCTVALLTIAPANASVIQYTNAAAFASATTATTTYNFDAFAPDNTYTYYGNTLAVAPFCNT
jgi:hypothetical protein